MIVGYNKPIKPFPHNGTNEEEREKTSKRRRLLKVSFKSMLRGFFNCCKQLTINPSLGNEG